MFSFGTPKSGPIPTQSNTAETKAVTWPESSTRGPLGEEGGNCLSDSWLQEKSWELITYCFTALSAGLSLTDRKSSPRCFLANSRGLPLESFLILQTETAVWLNRLSNTGSAAAVLKTTYERLRGTGGRTDGSVGWARSAGRAGRGRGEDSLCLPLGCHRSLSPECRAVCTFYQHILPMSQHVNNLPAMQGTWVQSLSQEVLLEEGTATHSSILAWRIPWTEEPGRLQSIGLQRVGLDWATKRHQHILRVQKWSSRERNYRSPHGTEGLRLASDPQLPRKAGKAKERTGMGLGGGQWKGVVLKHQLLQCPPVSSPALQCLNNITAPETLLKRLGL